MTRAHKIGLWLGAWGALVIGGTLAFNANLIIAGVGVTIMLVSLCMNIYLIGSFIADNERTRSQRVSGRTEARRSG
jgi:hypothetical protein